MIHMSNTCCLFGLTYSVPYFSFSYLCVQELESQSPPRSLSSSILPAATSTPMPGGATMPRTMSVEKSQHDSISRLSDDSGDEATLVQQSSSGMLTDSLCVLGEGDEATLVQQSSSGMLTDCVRGGG